jgi:hypothetical protein
MKHLHKHIGGLLLATVIACNSGFADERDTLDKKNTVETQRQLARDAIQMAAREAVKTVLKDTRLDLDIRLIGPTSVRIADDR